MLKLSEAILRPGQWVGFIRQGYWTQVEVARVNSINWVDPKHVAISETGEKVPFDNICAIANDAESALILHREILDRLAPYQTLATKAGDNLEKEYARADQNYKRRMRYAKSAFMKRMAEYDRSN